MAAQNESAARLQEARLESGDSALDIDRLELILDRLEQDPSPGLFERFLEWLAEWLGLEEAFDSERLAAAFRWIENHSDVFLYLLFGGLILGGILVVWLFARNFSWGAPSIRRTARDHSIRIEDEMAASRHAGTGSPLIDAWRRLLDNLEQQRLVTGVDSLTGREICERLQQQPETRSVATAFSACYPVMDRFIYDPAGHDIDARPLLHDIERIHHMVTT